MSKKRRVRKPKGQIWNVFLTFDERLRLRMLLNVYRPDGIDEIRKNNRSLDAVEGGEDFEVPPAITDEDERRERVSTLNARLESDEEDAVELTHENAQHILEVINSITKDKALQNLQMARGVDVGSGGFLRRLEEAIDRLEMAKNSKEEPGAVEKEMHVEKMEDTG